MIAADPDALGIGLSVLFLRKTGLDLRRKRIMVVLIRFIDAPLPATIRAMS